MEIEFAKCALFLLFELKLKYFQNYHLRRQTLDQHYKIHLTTRGKIGNDVLNRITISRSQE